MKFYVCTRISNAEERREAQSNSHLSSDGWSEPLDDVRLREQAESLSSDVCEPFFGDLLKSDSRDWRALLLLALQFPANNKWTICVQCMWGEADLKHAEMQYGLVTLLVCMKAIQSDDLRICCGILGRQS